MLKRLLLACAFAPVALPGQPDTTTGVMIGLSANHITAIAVPGFGHTGIQAAWYRGLPLSPNFSYRLEAGYMLRGSREFDSDTSNRYRADLHMITLPAVVVYHHGKVSLELGLSADFVVYARERNLYGEMDNNQRFNFVYLNAILGVNYDLGRRWMVGFRSHYGITPVRKSTVRTLPNSFGLSFSGQRTVSLTFGVYYRF